MENEIMTYEDGIMDNDVVMPETEGTEAGMSTGVAMLLGAGLTLATTALVKLGKKLVNHIKAKKALRLVEEGDVVEVTDEQVEDVTK